MDVDDDITVGVSCMARAAAFLGSKFLRFIHFLTLRIPRCILEGLGRQDKDPSDCDEDAAVLSMEWPSSGSLVLYRRDLLERGRRRLAKS